MPESALSRVSWNQLSAFDEAIEAANSEIKEGWKSEREKAKFAGNLRGVIRLSQDIPNILRALWQSTLDLIAARLIEDYEEKAQEIRKALNKAFHILNSLQELAQSFQAAGGSVQDVQIVDKMMREVQRLEVQIFAHWPDFADRDSADALAEYKRGECLEAGDAFAQIAGVDKKAWLRRVEDRKRMKQS